MSSIAVALVGILVGVTACVTSPAPQPPAERPSVPRYDVRHWQTLFDRAAPQLDRDSQPLSRSADSWDFYTLAYSIDAYTSMFEATGDRNYADTALDYVQSAISTARPSRTLPTSQFRDDYLGWVSQQPDVRGQEVPLYESYCWRYVTRLLRVLRASPLYADPGLRGRYDQVLAFTETDIFDKWYSRGADENIYRSRTHMASHWAYIALDLAEVTTNPQRRAKCLQVVGNINDGLPNYPSSLHAQMRSSMEDPEAYWWSSVWGSDNGESQDVAHGNGDIAYVVEAYDLRAGWTADDIRRLSRTLTSFVLGRDGQYPEFVDGSGHGSGWVADGFVKLGRYQPAVQAALEVHGVQNAQYFAAMAANAAILAKTANSARRGG